MTRQTSRLMTVMVLALGGAALTSGRPSGQASQPAVPVIDMHVHTTNTTPAALESLAGISLRYVFLAGLAADLREWATSYHGGYVPALGFPCADGRAPFVPRACFDTPTDLPDVNWLRGELQSGRLKALGELIPEYFGMSPQDARLEPYWALAEELDVPVSIHMGPGPPGTAYAGGISPVTFPAFKMTLGDPLLLEDVLLRHKRLRLNVAHAGWPRLESMQALLYAHPNVYVDLGALTAEFMVPRAAYYSYLRALVEAGFAKRIMFGSDFPAQVGPGVNAILAATFLTDEQKADILCENAARFLRLPVATCAGEAR